MSFIVNASDRPLFALSGAVPNVSGALRSYFQQMTFVPIKKTVSGFQVVESATPIDLQGVIQPFSTRQLLLKPEGERAWTWWTLHAQIQPKLQVDSCFEYLGQQYRVAARKDNTLYGFMEYELVQDWRMSGP